MDRITAGTKAQIRHKMGNVHVATPTDEVIAMWKRICKKSKCSNELEAEVIAYALEVHAENIKLYNQVMRGF